MKTTTTSIPYLKNFIWKNITGLIAKPERFYQPKSLQDIQDIIQLAERENLKVRAVGSGHSFTDIAMSKDILIDPNKYLHQILPINRDALNKYGQSLNLIRVESGIRIEDLNKKLDKKGLALINMGAIDEQTISGAITTNTHGTGINLPAMSGFVQSMVQVSAGGKAYRIEPTNGITDAAQYNDAEIELIQNDEIFYSAVLGLGCMGIIYSYTLEVQEKYWLCETRKIMSWETVKQKLLDPSNPLFQPYELRVNYKTYKRKPRGVYILINPFERPLKGRMENACMVMQFMEVDPPSRFFASSLTMTRNWISTLFSKFKLTYYFALYRANKTPWKLPNIIQTTIKTMEDRKFLNKSFRVLHQGSEYLMSKGYGSEFAYNFKDKKFIEAVEAIFAKMKSLEKEPDLYPSSPIGLRFVKASKFYLAPEYQAASCYIANPVFIRQNRSKEIVDYYQDIHLAHGGIPHWGKMTNKLEEQKELIPTLYPKFSTWQSVMRRFNPNGTFGNEFTERMGLTNSKSNILKYEKTQS